MAKKKSGVPKVKAEDAASTNTTIKLNSKCLSHKWVYAALR